MKNKTKGIIVAAFFGVILLTSTLSLAFNSMPKPVQTTTITGTPQDNFPDDQRPRFCGTGQAKSNDYVTEFKIPTICTQPLAITVDPQGNVWFAQTNTGKIAKFDPKSMEFTEYENSAWPPKSHSMMWSMDYSGDGSLWYTDDAHNSIWRFSTTDGTYEQIPYSTDKDSLPQQIVVRGSQVVLNDFYGGKISFLDITQRRSYTTIPTPMPGSFVAGFDFDSSGNLWYTNWVLGQGGVLVRLDYTKFATSEQKNVTDFVETFTLPASLRTPVGLVVDTQDNIWIADTSSSSFFKFSPSDEKFTRYVTSEPPVSVYGNATGVIKTPSSGPYWMQILDNKLVFNEQLANAVAVFDFQKEKLVEYAVPSQNPNWFDCAGISSCGIAQVFAFKAAGDKIWFTEWAENNIGVVDLAKPLQFEPSLLQKQLTIQKGQTSDLTIKFAPQSKIEVKLASATTSEFGDIIVKLPDSVLLDDVKEVPVSITASDSALPGTYKVLISARTSDVTISEFVSVTVTP